MITVQLLRLKFFLAIAKNGFFCQALLSSDSLVFPEDYPEQKRPFNKSNKSPFSSKS